MTFAEVVVIYLSLTGISFSPVPSRTPLGQGSLVGPIVASSRVVLASITPFLLPTNTNSSVLGGACQPMYQHNRFL